ALQIPHQPEALQKLQEIEGRIIFPPAETLAGAALVGVMIVMPALAHGDDGEKPVVARVVAGDIAPASDEMGDRVDAERRMIDRDRAPEEADDQPRPASDGETEDGERERRRQFVTVEPHQLRITGEIRHPGEIGHLLAAGENPAEVTVDETEAARRMNVELRIGMEVVVAMVGRPPQNALLRRRLRHGGENQLEGAAGLIGAVGKVAVITGADGEDAQPVKTDSDRQRLRGDASPDRRETRQMHDHEWYGGRIDDVGIAVWVQA